MRKKTNKKTDKKIFKRTANNIDTKNIYTGGARGGIRL